jgi:hypothetical protein
VLADFRTARISAKEKALFTFVEKLNRESTRLTQADVDQAKAAGWSDEALYDAISVCALFNFYNKWVDGAGVSDMSGSSYAAAGKRMAQHGYVRQAPQ